jgi:hypothetical protein
MFITRVVLPNIIKANRKHMLSMYISRKNLPAACRLRYDCVLNTADPFITVPATAIIPHIANWPIFRSIMTPNGVHFLQWLRNLPATPPPQHPVPHQMMHRVSDIDIYMTDNETRVRSMKTDDLIKRTAKALIVWWRITCNTSILMDYERKDWIGAEQDF